MTSSTKPELPNISQRRQKRGLTYAASNIRGKIGEVWTYGHGDIRTRSKAKPVGTPPGYPTSRLLISVNWSVNRFACVQCALALLVVRGHLTNRTRTQFCGSGLEK